MYNRELLKKRSERYDVANFSSKIDLIYDNYFLNKWLIVENITLFVFSALAIISINWIMLIVAISVSLIPMFVPSVLQKYVQKAAKMYSDESTEYIDFLNDSLLGRLEIVKYRVIDHFLNKHNIANDYLESKRSKNRIANNNANSLTGAVGNATFLIVFLAGGLLSMRGLMTIGGVIGVVQLMNNVVRPIVGIAQYKNEMNSCKPIIKELSCDMDNFVNKTSIKQEYDTESKDQRINNKKSSELVVKNIYYKYPGMSEPIIQGFSYTFERGKKYLIIGESGVGKSTLAKILTGELISQEGQVCFDGEDIKSLSLVERIRRINYVDQQSYVFKDTIKNNISMY